MGQIGHGYGSEWHLLRLLGRHRNHLNRLILETVPGQHLEWLDHEFDPSQFTGDRELVGLGFLPEDHPARSAWRQVWPSSGNSQNWDAVARIDGRGWLLVEAKGNLEEIRSSCGAKENRSKAMIGAALSATREHLGCAPDADWLTPYYQYANRLVVLDHLVRHGEDAHLLFIYFCGDRGGPRRTCPSDPAEWAQALALQQRALGLPDEHVLSNRIHRLFLDVTSRTTRPA